MSKQTTLFNSWGGRTAQKEPGSGSKSSIDSGQSNSKQVVSAPSGKEEEYGFQDDDEFFADELAETELLETVESYESTTHNVHNNPSTTTQRQTPLPFHVGPSTSILNSSITEESIPGFDSGAGELWIYPTNYPVRDYQFNIVQKSLLTNTLVCLPTGLGKTFIAAVVMYNFYRWYPNGKIVFLAPTKPLVAQQIEACYGVMGIPQEDAAEMTGNLPPKERVLMWRNKRVFFLTPQVMQNDLNKGTCPAQDVCCVVFDEAHKALGNHAYCQVVKELTKAGSSFRVLALSATPGNDLKAVQHVVSNLQIGRIELRSEDSFDIQRYVHERRVEKIVVPLEGEILEIKNNFLKVLSKVIGRLASCGVLYHGNAERMSKYQLLQAREQFRAGPPPAGVMSGAVEGDFALAISLFHAFELLQLHGMRSFHQFLLTTFTASGQLSKAKLQVLKSPLFNGILRRLKEKFGPGSATDGDDTIPSPRFSISGPRAFNPVKDPSSPSPFVYSHPKLQKLEEVVLKHFRNFNPEQSSSTANDGSVNTRVMIFSQYRESVQEIADMLKQHSPLVRVMSFVGHGASKSSSKGLSQKEQTEIVKKFRVGGYNTLVATCVGEEGLDIGEVDLIVCFDAAKSPIRLVQRMGRTGRKRNGKIVVIVAEGKEDQIYNKSQSNKKSIHRAIRDGCKHLTFFPKCPRMVPRHIAPQAHKMQMTIGEFVSSKPNKRGGKKPASDSNQSKLSFGSHKRKRSSSKHAYLSPEELRCWSNELALSDREFRGVERSVNRCFSSTPFLSVSKLRGSREDSTTPNISILSPNTSLNSSTARINSKFSLSLEKWTHFQTAPISTKLANHSLRSQQLTSTLEFMDLIRTSDDVGLNYDAEMQMFLKQEDVKIRARDCGDKVSTTKSSVPVSKSNSDEQIAPKRRWKRCQLLEDLSEDEDFQAPVPALTGGKRTSTSPNPDIPNPTTHKKDLHMDDDVQIIEDHDPPATERPVSHDDDNEHQNETDRFVDLTASQHVVPRAPSPDSLDWLDSLEPSQFSTPCVPKASASILKSSTKGTSCTKVGLTPKKSVGFEFVTPKAPLNSRLSKVFVATSLSKSSQHTVCTSGKPPMDSIDLIEDLSANALFEDFSTDENTTRNSLKNSPLPTEKASVSVRDGDQEHVDPTSVQDEHVSVIEESDFEGDFEDDNSPPLNDNNHSPASLHHTTAVVTPNRAVMSTSVSTDDSFIRVHGKHRKRPCGNKFQSPNMNEKKSAKDDFSDESESWLSSRNTRVVGVSKGRAAAPLTALDSSDEEFAEPLVKRIRRQKQSSESRQNKNSHDIAAPTTSKGASKGVKSIGYMDEEAEESSDERPGGGSDIEERCEENDYDFDDSFINDNSMLTQISPTQRVRFNKPKASTKQGTKSGNMYLQSLMSPEDRLFGSKRKRQRGGFRMVLSQRHCILNHYINKAGFKVDDSGGKKSRKKSKSAAKERSAHSNEDRHLFSTESSGSEAEEVWLPDDDIEELSHTQELEEQSSLEESVDNLQPPKISGKVRKRRGNFLSDSDLDTSHHENNQTGGPSGGGGGQQKKPRISSSPERESRSDSAVCLDDRPPVLGVPATLPKVVISPSLLVGIKIERTPPCFSLGMDDWLTDIDYANMIKEDNPVNHQPVDDEPIEILTQKDIENFEEGFSDTELM